MEITEKWLAEMGGWQAMKTARMLADAGAVTEARADGDARRGIVTEGSRRYQSGLIARSRVDIENLCSCPLARGRGVMCAHALAVALVVLRGSEAQAAELRRPGSSRSGSGYAAPLARGYASGQTSSPAASQAPRTAAPAAPASAQPLPPAPGSFAIFVPENVLDGSFKGQAAVFLKYEPGKGTEPDARLTAWLKTQGLRPGSMPLMLGRNDLASLLAAIAGHARVFAGKPNAGPDAALSVAEEPMRLPVRVTMASEPQQVSLAVDSASMQLVARAADSAWCYCASTRTLFALPRLGADLAALLDDLMAKAQGTLRPLAWLVTQRAALEEALHLSLEGAALQSLHLTPVPCEFELALDGSMQSVEAKLSATFGSLRWLAMTGTAQEVSGIRFPLAAEGDASRFYSRHMQRERAAMQRLEDAGFEIASSTTWRLVGAEKVGRFYASELPRLAKVFRIENGQRWLAATRGVLRISPKVLEPAGGLGVDSFSERRQGQDWLSLDIAYTAADGFRIGRSDVLQMIRSGRRSMTGKDGKRYVLDEEACEEFEESLRDLDGQMKADGVMVRSDKAAFLLSVDDATFEAKQAATWRDEAWLREQLPDLAVLLRPYQMTGIRWLEAAARGSGAGLLADDMGLGKTLQAIALLRLLSRGTGVPPVTGAEGVPPESTTNIVSAKSAPPPLGQDAPGTSDRRDARPTPGRQDAPGTGDRRDARPTPDSQDASPTLVICPKSLIGNWERELERFAPGLRVLTLTGTDRSKLFARMAEHDVVITTYQLVVRDLAQLHSTTFASIVVDEASYIRNPDTEAAKALRKLKATRRFALTGTPLENSVRDLWSIYHFLLPGYLGSRENFKERFENPLAGGVGSAEGRKVSERLRKLVRPYFLRRTKREVLTDLPEKMEQVLWCDLSKAQSEVYRRVLEEGQAEVKDARKRGGKGAVKLTMFTVLLRLRQICCDLRLTGMEPAALKGLDEEELSGKLTLWRDRLQEIIAAGGKVLVFSQFVKFLHLLKAELEREGIAFSYLDGQTQDRSAQVDAFQQQPEKKVFLISLKAGGYGLNLTAADHVMLMDPWWNPAVEAQAIDRAHRFGQERIVTALRLVSRGTVEEKILKLQAQKRGLIEAALDENQPLMAGLSEDDLASVLEM